jgi:hypothetical protein
MEINLKILKTVRINMHIFPYDGDEFLFSLKNYVIYSSLISCLSLLSLSKSFEWALGAFDVVHKTLYGHILCVHIANGMNILTIKYRMTVWTTIKY